MSGEWTMHERPDGHRSLWFKAQRWIIITADVRSPTVIIDDNANTMKVYCAGKWIATETTKRGCPAPTEEEIAWLRGLSPPRQMKSHRPPQPQVRKSTSRSRRTK